MTDDPTTNPTSGSGEGGQPGADETYGWSGDQPGATSRTGREWMAQLQSMIENLTEQATPVVRQVGAKAAELAALAGEKAGPVAHKAADMTAEAGQKLAVRSRDLAAELRRDQGAAPGAETPGTTATGTIDDSATGDAP